MQAMARGWTLKAEHELFVPGLGCTCEAWGKRSGQRNVGPRARGGPHNGEEKTEGRG